MKRVLGIIALLISTVCSAQYGDKCPDFTIRNHYSIFEEMPFGQWDYSIRHRQYSGSFEAGLGFPFSDQSHTRSKLAFNGAITLRLWPENEYFNHFLIQQDWIVQLKDKANDTIFTGNGVRGWVDMVVGSIGYEELHPRQKLTTIYALGLSGSDRAEPLSLVLVVKNKYGISHNTFLKMNFYWNIVDPLNMYDDRLYAGLVWGIYLDDGTSRYHR